MPTEAARTPHGLAEMGTREFLEMRDDGAFVALGRATRCILFNLPFNTM